ncbi:MAG: hypothetical protein ABSG95_02685 [Solirubrobacteraceae bacterium]|jgi:hypothetical protein
MSSLRSVFGPQARVVWRLTLVLVLIALAVLALIGAIDSLQTGVLTMLRALACLLGVRAEPRRSILDRRRHRLQLGTAVRPACATLFPVAQVATANQRAPLEEIPELGVPGVA